MLSLLKRLRAGAQPLRKRVQNRRVLPRPGSRQQKAGSTVISRYFRVLFARTRGPKPQTRSHENRPTAPSSSSRSWAQVSLKEPQHTKIPQRSPRCPQKPRKPQNTPKPSTLNPTVWEPLKLTSPKPCAGALKPPETLKKPPKPCQKP